MRSWPRRTPNARRRKNLTKKTEDGIVCGLAKQGLIDKTKAKAARKATTKNKKKKKGRGSSSSSSSYYDSCSDSDDSSGDDKKKKSKKRKPKKRDDDDTLTAKAKSKARKSNKMPELTQSAEEAQKGMLVMETELRELRGLPEAIQKQFEEHQILAS